MANLRVRIVCPESSAFEGEAAFVAVPSGDGEIGVLSGHASEICTVVGGRVRLSGGISQEPEHVFVVSNGYAEITANEVIILVERAVDAAQIDRGTVLQAKQSFEDKLSNLSQDDVRRAYIYNEIQWCELQLAS